MADAPPGGLYEPSVDATIEGGRLEVRGVSFGPAGISAVELPDGGVWEVDHSDPGRLVGLDVDATDPAGSPLLVAAFGGDGAMLVVDAAGGGRGSGRPIGRDPGTDLPVWPAPRHPGRLGADAAGRLVLLVDLAQDPSLDPVARTLAVVELAVLTRPTPGGDLFEPLLAGLLDTAEALAADPDTSAAGLAGMGSGRKPLHAAFSAFRARFGDSSPATCSLLDSLLSASEQNWDDDRAAFRQMAVEYSMDDEVGALSIDGATAAPGPDDVAHERVTPSLIEVTAMRSDAERWVRVLRRDGLVLLAQAPLARDGLVDRGEVLLPPDTHDDEIEIQVVDADRLTARGRGPADIIRDAVRAGRAAASAERRGDLPTAWPHWERSHALWMEVGDRERARAALRRTMTSGRRFRGGPLFADGVDPYGDGGS